MKYALDAGAMIAFLDNEPGADVVEDALTEPGSACYAHIVNLAEVYYVYYRRGGVTAAEDAIQALISIGVVVMGNNDDPFWKDAASFKGRHPLALPDGFWLALARHILGIVVTTDHAEFDALVPLGYCPILFIR